MGERVDLSDTQRADYKQPNCSICGRFAGRDRWGQWVFNCVTWTGEGWEHD